MKILGKCWENVGKILRESASFSGLISLKVLEYFEKNWKSIWFYSYVDIRILKKSCKMFEKNLLTLWEYFEENWKIFRFTCLVKILRNYKKYFEEIFGNLEKMIEE